MNKSDTQIVAFKDIYESVFTLKQGKSYNITKCENSTSLLGKKKYSFKIINCVSTDIFTLEYTNESLRDLEYSKFIAIYLTFNGMN